MITNLFLGYLSRLVIWLLLFFCCFPSVVVHAQPQFRHISIDEGLSNSSVLSIVQDKKGYMWFATRHGVNRYNAYSIKSFFSNSNDSTSLSSSYVRAMYCDSKGYIWMGTTGGLNRYDTNTERFEQLLARDGRKTITHDVINKIAEDHQSNIWVATNMGLNLFRNGETKQVEHFLTDKIIYTLSPDPKNGMWLGTSDGLLKMEETNGGYIFRRIEDISKQITDIGQNYIAAILLDGNMLYIGTTRAGVICYNVSTKTFETISASPKSKLRLSHNNVRDILKTKDQRLWVATQKGVNIVDRYMRTVELHEYQPEDRFSLSQNSVYTLYEDRQGLIWIGAYFGGVNVTYPDRNPFRIMQHHGTTNSISSNVISGIDLDSRGHLWIGTEAEGLNFQDSKTGRFETFREQSQNPHGLKSNLIKAIHMDRNDGVWIATYMGGMNYLNLNTQRFENYLHHKDDPYSIASNNVNCLTEDSQGRFWVGTNIGLQLFDRHTGRFQYLRPGNEKNKKVNELVIQYVYEDRDHQIWIGAIGGLYVLRKGQYVYERINLPDTISAQTHKINSILQDTEGNLWIGVFQGGLYKIDSKRPDHITHFSSKDGLPGDNIIGILEETNGVLWLSTNNGLCRFDTQNLHFMSYTKADGLPSNAFNNMAFFKAPDGRLYFGGHQGLVSFLPIDIYINRYSPTPIIESLRILHKRVAADRGVPILRDAEGEASVQLSYRENAISIAFPSLNYYKSSKNTYLYKLEGVDNEWRETDLPEATYTNLSEGHYVFLVKARNNDGFWSDRAAQLNIQITPPFWKTWYAYLFYVLLGIIFLYLLVQFFVIRKILQKEKEIHRSKLDFFTNISHEIRTPLTLIAAPLDRIFKRHDKTVPLTELHTVKDNADRLKELVNELLDFRKIETKNAPLNLVYGDLNQTIRRTLLYFKEDATTRDIQLDFQSNADSIPFNFDSRQLEKVFFNLLSNAFKYVDDGGAITIHTRDTQKEIFAEVRDNGMGIPPDLQANLFTAFFRADRTEQQGTGLGLAISKSIVELHGGKIRISGRERTPTQNGFTVVQIRFKKELKTDVDLVVEENLETLDNTSLDIPVQGDVSKVLVVEDNREMNDFICDLLRDKYEVMSVYDGASALSVCLDQAPDLIVSDVAMPEMDGFRLCHEIKTDECFDHIPVILLTAKTDSTHQLDGLKSGADLYITKPFDVDFLLVSIHNLLRTRENMRRKFSRFVKTGVPEKIEDTPEKIFIDKIVGIIEHDISNPQINVPFIISEMGMHHQTLYKKLRAITGLSVNDLIKTTRLKKATELLSDPTMNVSEVAYAVGFSDPKYFSKEFKKQFGKLPSDYRNGRKS